MAAHECFAAEQARFGGGFADPAARGLGVSRSSSSFVVRPQAMSVVTERQGL